MCCWHKELLPTWNACRFLFFNKNFSSCLEKTGKFFLFITHSTHQSLLANVTPSPPCNLNPLLASCFCMCEFHHTFVWKNSEDVSAWCFLLVVFQVTLLQNALSQDNCSDHQVPVSTDISISGLIKSIWDPYTTAFIASTSTNSNHLIFQIVYFNNLSIWFVKSGMFGLLMIGFGGPLGVPVIFIICGFWLSTWGSTLLFLSPLLWIVLLTSEVESAGLWGWALMIQGPCL